MRLLNKTPIWVLITGLAWVAAVSFGISRLLEYENTPGAPGSRRGAGLLGVACAATRAVRRWCCSRTPRCPCSRASLAELLQIITQCQGHVAAHLLFVAPEGVPPVREWTDL